MSISSWGQLPRRRAIWRVLPLALTFLIGWTSIEVLWDRDAAATADVVALADSDQERDASPEDDCHCLCACECRAVHVVPTGVAQPPLTSHPLMAGEQLASEAAPPDRGAEPPFRPPRHSS